MNLTDDTARFVPPADPSALRLGQAARNVLVKNAGDECLIRHTFFKRLNLNVTQIARGQAYVDPAILYSRSARGCLEFR